MADVILTMDDAAGAGGLGPATLDDLLKEVYDAVAKTNLQWQKSPTLLINQWIQKFANLHNWEWRQEYVELASVADQAYIALPANFGKMRWAVFKPRNLPLESVNWSHLQHMRSSNVSIVGSGYAYAIRFVDQASASDAPTARMELWPTPAASEAAVFAASYDRLLPALSDGDHIPDVPIIHHPLLRQMVRTEALRYDNQSEPWALERDELARMVTEAMSIDGQLQHAGRPIRGAVRQLQSGVMFQPHNTVGLG